MESLHTTPSPVLITGSSGLIGTRLAEHLATKTQYRPVGLDLKPPRQTPLGMDWIPCDLTNELDVARALGQVRNRWGERLASVVHLAAHFDLSGASSQLYRELTVEGTRRLLRQLRSFDTEQFVFASSLLVMKPSEVEPLTASAELQAEWDYPKSKLRAERVIAEERQQVAAVILRIAGVYDQRCHSMQIAQQVARIHQKQLESYFFPGDKTHGQAFVHLDDLVECIRLVIEKRRELPPYEIMLIGEEDVMSYEALQDQLGRLIHGTEWPTIQIPKPLAKAGVWIKEKIAGQDELSHFMKPWMVDLADQNYPVSIREARTNLGWEPQHRLRDTLPYMIGHLATEPKRWYEENGLPVPEVAS